MANYPELARYLGKGQIGPAYTPPDSNRKMLCVLFGSFAVITAVVGGGIFAITSFAICLYFGGAYRLWRRLVLAVREKAILQRAGSSDPAELKEMERGAAAWRRIDDALRQPHWTGVEAPESRRSAAIEVREAAEGAIERLVRANISSENRAWLAFGLERLAEEVERRPKALTDRLGCAIHNRQVLRLANELHRELLA